MNNWHMKPSSMKIKTVLANPQFVLGYLWTGAFLQLPDREKKKNQTNDNSSCAANTSESSSRTSVCDSLTELILSVFLWAKQQSKVIKQNVA